MAKPNIDKVNLLATHPKFAVCLAAYNGTQWFAEQLDSILVQENVALTVFVSVDASIDGTESWVDARARDDDRIVVLAHGEHFGGASRNFFRIFKEVNLLDFDYICLADQDDIWFPNKLKRAHQILLTTVSDGFSGNVLAFWSDGRKTLVQKAQSQVKWDFLFEAAGPGCTYVMRRELACDFQDFVKSHWDEVQAVGLHDWFVYAFARANGYRWVIDAVPSMLYRQHAANQVGVNAGWRAFVHRANKVLSGWGLEQSVLIARLVGLTEDPFVSRWATGSRLGLLYLALHASQCRRRVRDKFIFGLSCLALSLTRRSRR